MVKKSLKNYPKELPNGRHYVIGIEGDVNPGINIKNRALLYLVLKARGVRELRDTEAKSPRYSISLVWGHVNVLQKWRS